MKTCERTKVPASWVCALVAWILLSGCSQHSSDAKPLPQSVSSSSSHHVEDRRQVKALIAYRAMWNDLVAAATTSDPKHPRLDDHAAGGALELLRYMMRQDRNKGVITKGQLRLAPVGKNGEASKVSVRDCVDGADWLHFTRDGRLEDKIPGGHHRVNATAIERDGVWRVEHLFIDEVGTC